MKINCCLFSFFFFVLCRFIGGLGLGFLLFRSSFEANDRDEVRIVRRLIRGRGIRMDISLILYFIHSFYYYFFFFVCSFDKNLYRVSVSILTVFRMVFFLLKFVSFCSREF